MTTEDDFRRALVDNPSDWQLRLVFADWLQDRGDPRSEGYRALGTLRWTPWERTPWGPTSSPTWWDFDREAALCPSRTIPMKVGQGELPGDWFELIRDWFRMNDSWVKEFANWAHAEDAAARAFARLPVRRRRSLLTASVYARRKREKKGAA
jgi:uncharacterized protein (TIGR02996 family)